MQIIEKYFPHLTDVQKQQLEDLDALYREWNSKINVISRKDIDNLYEHHVLHSLAIAEAIRFKDGTRILDEFGICGQVRVEESACRHGNCQCHRAQECGGRASER